MTDKGHRLPRLYREIQVFQHPYSWRILEAHILKFDTSFVECEELFATFLAWRIHQFKHAVTRSHRLLETRHDIHKGLNRLINAVDIINKRIEEPR